MHSSGPVKVTSTNTVYCSNDALGTTGMLPNLLKVREVGVGRQRGQAAKWAPMPQTRGSAKSSFVGSCRQQARGNPTKLLPRQKCGAQGARPRTKTRPPSSQDKRSELNSEFLGGPMGTHTLTHASVHRPKQITPFNKPEMPLMTNRCSWQTLPGVQV